jgi:hypothetical protein
MKRKKAEEDLQKALAECKLQKKNTIILTCSHVLFR